MELITTFKFLQCDEGDKPDATHLPAELMAICRRRWPQFFPKSNEIMLIELPAEDPLIGEVTGFFEDHGRKAVWDRFSSISSNHPTLYKVRGIRRFDPVDIESAQFLRGVPEQIIFQGGMRKSDGSTEVDIDSIRPVSIGQSGAATPVCKGVLRRELESEAFTGLTFRAVSVKSRRGRAECLWELWSDRVMPPMKNARADVDGRPFDIPRRNGCVEADFFQPPLLRFERSEVERLLPFDFALTREAFGPAIGQYGEGDGSKLLDPRLIVSQRFRTWCEEKRIKFEWSPIALE